MEPTNQQKLQSLEKQNYNMKNNTQSKKIYKKSHLPYILNLEPTGSHEPVCNTLFLNVHLSKLFIQEEYVGSHEPTSYLIIIMKGGTQ